MKEIRAYNCDAVFLVSDEDYEFVSTHRWRLTGDYAYGPVCRIPMHRFIMARHENIDGKQVDHKNLNTWDNTRDNLRISTPSQNGANQGVRKNNTSGFKGVSLAGDKFPGKWIASISPNRTSEFIGHFDTAEDAAVAYDVRAVEIFGEFARVNIPNPDPEIKQRVMGAMTSPKRRSGASRFIGVTPVNRRWRAQLSSPGYDTHIGYFSTEEEAARAIDAACIARGVKRRLNFPSDALPN